VSTWVTVPRHEVSRSESSTRFGQIRTTKECVFGRGSSIRFDRAQCKNRGVCRTRLFLIRAPLSDLKFTGRSFRAAFLRRIFFRSHLDRSGLPKKTGSFPSTDRGLIHQSPSRGRESGPPGQASRPGSVGNKTTAARHRSRGGRRRSRLFLPLLKNDLNRFDVPTDLLLNRCERTLELTYAFNALAQVLQSGSSGSSDVSGGSSSPMPLSPQLEDAGADPAESVSGASGKRSSWMRSWRHCVAVEGATPSSRSSTSAQRSYWRSAPMRSPSRARSRIK
jgi:hypothetical protein